LSIKLVKKNLANSLINQSLIEIAEKISKVNQGIATDEDGKPTETYLKYLSLMFSPDEAEIVQFLDVFPKSKSLLRLSKQSGKEKSEIKEMLDSLVDKGFLVGGGKNYSILNPIQIHNMPFSLKRIYESENALQFAKLSRKFLEEEGYYYQWQTTEKGIPRLRVLTVSEKVEVPQEILPVEEIYSIINKNTSFAIVPCVCRNRAEVEGIRKCKDKYPINNCIFLGVTAEFLLNLGDPVIKRASKDEVIEIVKEGSELGLIHNTENFAGESTLICECCSCCCSHISGLTRLNNPRAIAKANYIANINEDTCTACETCLDRCKFGAIVIEQIAHINEEKCIGCGVCAVTCPNEAITMKRLEREQIPVGINPQFSV